MSTNTGETLLLVLSIIGGALLLTMAASAFGLLFLSNDGSFQAENTGSDANILVEMAQEVRKTYITK